MGLMDQFFYSTQIYEDNIILPEDEAHHALKVLRKHKGDKIVVVDGNGGWFECVIVTEEIQNCRLRIEDKRANFGLREHYIHIGIAPPKSHDRVEWFVEKAVEIGVQEISFILTDQSERKNIKLERILKRTISSMKQSLKAYLPKINDIIPIKDFVINCSNGEKFIGYVEDDQNSHLFQSANSNSNYCILIGPEGGFTSSEFNAAQDIGFQSVSLGDSRLRTETAGLAACHILNLVNIK